MGQHEVMPDDVGCRLQQHLALDQRLAHQAEFVIFEIAQAAMDQLGAGRRCGAGEVCLLGKQDLQAPPRHRRDPAFDAAADDEQIDRSTRRLSNVPPPMTAGFLAPPRFVRDQVFSLSPGFRSDGRTGDFF
jgi:hypothetical protein